MDSDKDVPGGCTLAEVIGSRRNLKVVEYLGGETVQRRTQKKAESLRSSVELCQEGIEQMHGLH
jgi:hypothetical protein